MSFQLIEDSLKQAIPLIFVNKTQLSESLQESGLSAIWMAANNFKAGEGDICTVPDSKGGIDSVVVGLGDKEVPGIWSVAGLSHALPSGTYCLEDKMSSDIATEIALGWAIGSYQFTRYKRSDRVWRLWSGRIKLIGNRF